MTSAQSPSFTAYQVGLISLIGAMLFTIVVDYMALSTLSAVLLPALDITTQEFGWVVSAYAFSAGTSGLVAMGVADRFGRKRLLLIYYGGFLVGMLLCASASSLTDLVVARVVTGAFGGVVASVCFAIIADLFADDQRGRVMGYVQLAFAAGLVVGLPLALYLATTFYWQLLHVILFLLGLVLLTLVVSKLQPVDQHLGKSKDKSVWSHVLHIVRQPTYWQVFATNFFLVLGDVMFMTFGSTYLTNNLGLSVDDLPLVFGFGGVATIVLSPLVGKLTGRFGKWRVFATGTVSTMVLVGVFSNMGVAPYGSLRWFMPCFCGHQRPDDRRYGINNRRADRARPGGIYGSRCLPATTGGWGSGYTVGVGGVPNRRRNRTTLSAFGDHRDDGHAGYDRTVVPGTITIKGVGVTARVTHIAFYPCLHLRSRP